MDLHAYVVQSCGLTSFHVHSTENVLGIFCLSQSILFGVALTPFISLCPKEKKELVPTFLRVADCACSIAAMVGLFQRLLFNKVLVPAIMEGGSSSDLVAGVCVCTECLRSLGQVDIVDLNDYKTVVKADIEMTALPLHGITVYHAAAENLDALYAFDGWKCSEETVSVVQSILKVQIALHGPILVSCLKDIGSASVTRSADFLPTFQKMVDDVSRAKQALPSEVTSAAAQALRGHLVDFGRKMQGNRWGGSDLMAVRGFCRSAIEFLPDCGALAAISEGIAVMIMLQHPGSGILGTTPRTAQICLHKLITKLGQAEQPLHCMQNPAAALVLFRFCLQWCQICCHARVLFESNVASRSASLGFCTFYCPTKLGGKLRPR